MTAVALVHQPVRFAARSLTRAPGFAVTAALTLALGIGLSTAVFTVADALLLRRLPVGDQDGLVVLWGEKRDGSFSNFPLAVDDVREFERRSRSLDRVAFFAFRGAVPTPIRAGDRVLPLRSALVSGSFFDVLQSRPALGRALRPEDDIVGAAPVLVISHRAWQQYFGGDSAIVGRSITMIETGRSLTIVGVMPQGLEYPRGTAFWAPLVAYSAAGGFLDRVSGEVDMLARLRLGASPAQARAELTDFLDRPEAPAWQRSLRGTVHTLPDIVLGDTKPALRLVTLAGALLLLITCVNVGNLMLVRALGRVREVAVRSALGASRGRLVAQLLTESGLLSMVGGVLGVAFAVAAVRTFVALAPGGFPRLDEIAINRTVLIASLLITAAAMLLSGLAPTLFTSLVNAQDVLRSGSHQSRSRRVRAAAEGLVVAQLALATVSLSAAALMTRSLMKLVRVDLAFAPAQLLVAELAVRQDQLGDARKQRDALDLLLPRLEALPGVRAVSPVLTVPFSGAGGGLDGRLSTPEQSLEEAAAGPYVNMEVVAPNYFATLGIPVLRGRAFVEEDRDGTAPVVIVSRSTAQKLWPGGDPLGKRVTIPGGEGRVVGVVPDTRYRELQVARASVYFPLRQSRFPVGPTTLLIRTSNAPAEVIPALRRAVAEANPGLTLANASSLELLLDAPRAQPRLNAMVLMLFATAAVLLAAIGLFAVITMMVRQRTRELGIRMALGATAGDIRSMIMVRGLALAAVGAAVGIGGALATSRLLSALLFEISPTDGPTLASVAALMLGMALLSSVIPARESMQIDPVIALRSET